MFMFFSFDDVTATRGASSKEKNSREELFKLLMAQMVELREKISYEIDANHRPVSGMKVNPILADSWTIANYWRTNKFSFKGERNGVKAERVYIKHKVEAHKCTILLKITAKNKEETYTFKQFEYLFKLFGYIKKENNTSWDKRERERIDDCKKHGVYDEYLDSEK